MTSRRKSPSCVVPGTIQCVVSGIELTELEEHLLALICEIPHLGNDPKWLIRWRHSHGSIKGGIFQQLGTNVNVAYDGKNIEIPLTLHYQFDVRTKACAQERTRDMKSKGCDASTRVSNFPHMGKVTRSARPPLAGSFPSHGSPGARWKTALIVAFRGGGGDQQARASPIVATSGQGAIQGIAKHWSLRPGCR